MGHIPLSYIRLLCATGYIFRVRNPEVYSSNEWQRISPVPTGVINRINIWKLDSDGEKDLTAEAKGQREEHVKRNGSAHSTVYRRDDEGERLGAIRKMYFAKDRETRLLHRAVAPLPDTAAIALRCYMANQPFHATFTILFYFEGYIFLDFIVAPIQNTVPVRRVCREFSVYL